MAKEAQSGPSKSELLKEHGDLYLKKLKGQATDQELSHDSARLEDMGIQFSQIVAVRQKVKDRFERRGVASVI